MADPQNYPRSRNLVFNTLLALGASLSWNDGVAPAGQIKHATRRPQLPAKFMGLMPALAQAEYANETAQQRGMPQRRVVDATWLIYHFDGDDAGIPGLTTAAILDACDALFSPGPQTLGGICSKVWIEGETKCFGGNLDAQVLLVIPLKVLLP